MGKTAAIIALLWLAYCVVQHQPPRSDGTIRDTLIVSADTIFPTPAKWSEPEPEPVFDIRQALVDTFYNYINVRELTGNNDGPEVEMFIAASGLDPKGGYPWCASFISYIYQANGLGVPPFSARAAAWFPPEKLIPDKTAISGDVYSLYYPSLGRIGHIGMYLLPYENETPYIVGGEGNTNAEGSREGNRVAKRMRPRATIHNSANWVP